MRTKDAMSEHQMTNPENQESSQLLHLVFGGELESLDSLTFRDLDKLDIVGIYSGYDNAYKAWKNKAQQTVDNAHQRYFIVHIHRLMDPEATGTTASKG